MERRKMSPIRRILAIALVAALAHTAGADLLISNVVIEGSLASGATYNAGTDGIDFVFPNAVVGDPVDPLRAGTLIVTFDVESDVPIDRDLLSILGVLSGSGTVFFNEVVEDLDNPGIIATYGIELDETFDLPYTDVVAFDYPVTHFKVKKSAVLTAIDADEFGLDVASIAVIEQVFVPEPALALPLVLLAVGVRRRR
jgi:hypothetical protein